MLNVWINEQVFWHKQIDKDREHLMKSLAFCITVIFMFFSAANARADETLLRGTVISLDRDSGRIIMCAGKMSGLTADCNATHRIVIIVEDRWIPGGVRPGRMARAWGSFGKKRTTFYAKAVRPGCGRDMTGIRGRLRKTGYSRGQCTFQLDGDVHERQSAKP